MIRSPHLMKRISQRILTITVLGALAVVSSSARAEESCDGSKIKLIVRTIEASDPRPLHAPDTSEPTAIVVEDSLTDIKPKLSLLPFSSFRLIAKKEEEISLKKKESLQLPNGQTLSFRPMYMENERVCMWLSWKDSDGSDILNTRIHFDADESVLTGTDYHDNEGRILAIRAIKPH
jgi:hypothetical protein